MCGVSCKEHDGYRDFGSASVTLTSLTRRKMCWVTDAGKGRSRLVSGPTMAEDAKSGTLRGCLRQCCSLPTQGSTYRTVIWRFRRSNRFSMGGARSRKSRATPFFWGEQCKGGRKGGPGLSITPLETITSGPSRTAGSMWWKKTNFGTTLRRTRRRFEAHTERAPNLARSLRGGLVLLAFRPAAVKVKRDRC
jgi:hypothetical protein